MTTTKSDDKAQNKVPYGRWFWVLICCAIAAGLAMVYIHRMDTPDRLTADALDYHNLAMQLLREHSYGSTYRVPAYPALLALVYAVTGPNLPAVYLVQAMLFVASLVLVYTIAYKLVRKETTSLIALAVCILWPPFWRSLTDVLTETLALFLVTATVWQILSCIEKASVGRCLAAGILLAMATLCKAVMIPYILIAALLVLMPKGAKKPNWAGAFILLVAASVCLGAWTVRNYRVTGEIIPVATGGGFNFWLGNWSPYYHHVWVWQDYPPELARELAGKTEVEQDKIFTRVAVKQMTREPLTAAGMFIQKFSDLWLAGFGRDVESLPTPVRAIGRFSIPKLSLVSIPLFILAIVGYRRLSREERSRALPVTLLMIWWTAAYLLTTVAPVRYVLPVQTFEVVLAAVAISDGVNRLAMKRKRATA
ncbi:MAG: ArnT family glycosyltransferase [Armatimonadota bacterium]